jgi:hypothetical protein
MTSNNFTDTRKVLLIKWFVIVRQCNRGEIYMWRGGLVIVYKHLN